MREQRLLTISLILLGLLVAIFFGLRTLHSFRRMHGRDPFNGKPPPAIQTDVELIRDWMTVPYIADTYGVPPDVIFKHLDIPLGKQNGRKSLKELNDEYYPDQPGVVLLQVKRTIQAFQIQAPPPPGASTVMP